MTEMKEKKNEVASVLGSIFGNQQKDTEIRTEDVAKIITEWLNPKHVKAKTRLTKRQVIALTILQSLADTYNIVTLKRFLQEFRINKLSEDGKSSEELENILKMRVPDQNAELAKLSRFIE